MTEILSLNEETVFALEELEQTLFSDPWSKESLKAHLSSPYGLSLGILNEKKLLSYGLFQIIGEEAEVLRIGTDPSYTRNGLATEILHTFEKEAEKRGAKSLFLEVRSQNEGAKNLYEKQGFHLIGKRSAYYKNPDDDALIYQKKKTEPEQK